MPYRGGHHATPGASASTRILIAIASCAGALALASCTSTGTDTVQPSGSQHSSGQPGRASPTSSASPVSCPGGWQTGSLTVTHHVTVPPVPVVTAIRSGTHPECKYDRIVLDVTGATPGYTVHFVPKVIQDASGKTLVLPGTRYLTIKLSPAQGHTTSGQASVNDTLKGQLDLEAHGGRTLDGVAIRVAQRILAMATRHLAQQQDRAACHQIADRL